MTPLEEAGVRQILNNRIELWLGEAERLRKRQAGWHECQASQKLAEEVNMQTITKCAEDLRETLEEILA